MLNLLISAGRFTVVIAAIMMIVASTIYGGFIGSALFAVNYSLDRSAGLLSSGVLFSALGFLFGVLAAGSVFGIAAAIFDMQRSLRVIANGRRSIVSGGSDWPERAAARAEPRL